MRFFFSVFTASLRQRMRRISVWVVLLLLPCMIFAIHKALPDQSVTAPVTVGVALPEEGGEQLWAALENRSGTVLSFVKADSDTIDRNIAAGRWDCGVIVDEDFTDLLEDMDTDRIFTLRIGEGSTVYPLVRETVAACMAALVTEPIARDYLQDTGIPADSQRLTQVLSAEERVEVTMVTADGTPMHPFQLGGRSVQRILYWLIGAMVLVWLLLAAHDLGRWSRSGSAKRMLGARSLTLLLCGRMAAQWLLILLPGWLTMLSIGGGFAGCVAVLCYSLFWSSVGIIVAHIPAIWQSIPVLPPFAVVLSLLFGGALLDLGNLLPALSPICTHIPGSLFLRLCSGEYKALLPLLITAPVLLGLSVIMDHTKKR